MTKQSLKSIMTGFCVFVATAIIFWLIYMVSVGTSAEKALEGLAAEEQSVSASSKPLSKDDIIYADYYLARCEGNTLSVYACSDGNEEFLYTIDVRIEDLSPDDLLSLQTGVILNDRQSLASFEEDFGS